MFRNAKILLLSSRPGFDEPVYALTGTSSTTTGNKCPQRDQYIFCFLITSIWFREFRFIRTPEVVAGINKHRTVTKNHRRALMMVHYLITSFLSPYAVVMIPFVTAGFT